MRKKKKKKVETGQKPTEAGHKLQLFVQETAVSAQRQFELVHERAHFWNEANRSVHLIEHAQLHGVDSHCSRARCE